MRQEARSIEQRKTEAGTARRRGRPAASFFSVEEVAERLALEPKWLRNALDKDARSFFPGAWREAQRGWCVPQRDLRRLLGPGEPKLYRVRDFADLISFSVGEVYELIKRGAIPKRLVFGKIRISAQTYWKLPEQMPAMDEDPKRAAARRSFFSRKSGGIEQEGGEE